MGYSASETPSQRIRPTATAPARAPPSRCTDTSQASRGFPQADRVSRVSAQGAASTGRCTPGDRRDRPQAGAARRTPSRPHQVPDEAAHKAGEDDQRRRGRYCHTDTNIGPSIIRAPEDDGVRTRHANRRGVFVTPIRAHRSPLMALSTMYQIAYIARPKRISLIGPPPRLYRRRSADRHYRSTRGPARRSTPSRADRTLPPDYIRPTHPSRSSAPATRIACRHHATSFGNCKS